MTLDDLRVLVAVHETGNLSAVARAMACTQSAVSQHIRRLERETGLALIERQPRGVVPTEAGRVLYRAALSGIAALDGALRQLDDMRDGHGGTVRVTTGGVTVRHFMADAITGFRQRHPRVALEFRSAHSARRCIELLHAGRVDLAWITLGRRPTGVEQRPVVDLPWVLLVRADDPLADNAVIDPEDLATIRYIGHPENSASHQRLEEDFARLGVRPSDPVGVADWETAVLLAELGVGHAILPGLPGLVGASDSPVRAIPVPTLSPLTVGWAVRRWEALSPIATAFADLVTAGNRAGGAGPPEGQVVRRPAAKPSVAP